MQKIINVGCGKVCYPCAENIDIDIRLEKAVYGDVHDLKYQKGTIDVVTMISPYLYYPLRSDAARVLKPGGLLVVVGSTRNRYFKSIWKASSNELEGFGFELISKSNPPYPDLQESFISDGTACHEYIP
ncbi:hypothetical protein ACIFOT_00915 [Neobacillus sp. NRS-1170]|uniref:hypothetical protein n=1 Tax=Neobacillus sp. NRS-1170 TaxID=3233898 RepID=UPI003D2D2614